MYATTTLLTNIAEDVARDHRLPSRVSIDELLRLLAPARISTYKELWNEDQERTLKLQRPSIGDLLAKVYRHWQGEPPPERAWNTLQFNLALEGSLLGLNLAIMEHCYEIEIS